MSLMPAGEQCCLVPILSEALHPDTECPPHEAMASVILAGDMTTNWMVVALANCVRPRHLALDGNKASSALSCNDPT